MSRLQCGKGFQIKTTRGRNISRTRPHLNKELNIKDHGHHQQLQQVHVCVVCVYVHFVCAVYVCVYMYACVSVHVCMYVFLCVCTCCCVYMKSSNIILIFQIGTMPPQSVYYLSNLVRTRQFYCINRAYSIITTKDFVSAQRARIMLQCSCVPALIQMNKPVY